MAREIESDFQIDYWNEDRQCRLCDSFTMQGDKCICPELEIEITPQSHCDFFRSKD